MFKYLGFFEFASVSSSWQTSRVFQLECTFLRIKLGLLAVLHVNM
jgi:hypothetical protein